jgi:hypothetical protein
MVGMEELISSSWPEDRLIAGSCAVLAGYPDTATPFTLANICNVSTVAPPLSLPAAVGGSGVDAEEGVDGEVEVEAGVEVEGVVGTVFVAADPPTVPAVLLPVSLPPPPHAVSVPRITRLAMMYFTDISPSSMRP